MNKLIETYKSVQRKQYFKRLGNYKLSYAFVGAGTHSIANLYPCIRHLGIPLRYICTQHPENAQKLAAQFPNCTGVSSIETILEDSTVQAVFISTQADRHFELTRRFLEKGKHVFVEKPVCMSLSALEQLINIQGDSICMPGLQKRFSPVNRILEKKADSADSYVCRYVTGGYPDGDAIMELFVHPVENLVRLFGEAAIKSILLKKNGGSITCFLQLQHISNTIGTVELSTDYSWDHPLDTLEVNSSRELLSANYPYELNGIPKSRTILNIPLEKVFKSPLVQKKYINSPAFVPVADHNSLVMQGFYGEIEHFAFLAEHDDRDAFCRLETLLPTYDILEYIKKEALA